ncbi:hypothetical protein [Mycoplasmopsis edwardii]|uniref:Uncharacterized protein n=1 Tax=Mycoplasmopsis edwardii TaxID=53558 RepID=A0ACD4PI20_9BACT|nr:hypothetical protein [Mycoplasmopsis edwardii]WBP84245.1 hypothetical protein Me_995_000219 [Mycoplasmopsis edwardii]
MESIVFYLERWLKKKKLTLTFIIFIYVNFFLLIILGLLIPFQKSKTNEYTQKIIEIFLFYIQPISFVIAANLLVICLFFAYKSYKSNAQGLSDEEFDKNFKEPKFPSYFNLLLLKYLKQIDISLVNNEIRKDIYTTTKRNNFIYLLLSLIVALLIDILFIVIFINWFKHFISIAEINNIFLFTMIAIISITVLIIFISKWFIIKKVKKLFKINK